MDLSSQLGADVDKIMVVNESEDKRLKCIRCESIINDADHKIQLGLCNSCHRSMYDSFLDKHFNSCIVCLGSLNTDNCLPKHDCKRFGIYVCEFCDARFDADTDLARHRERRVRLLETINSLVSFCNLISKSDQKLSFKLRRLSRKNERSNAAKISSNVCNKSFANSSALELHLKMDHFNDKISDSNVHNNISSTSQNVESSKEQEIVGDSTLKLTEQAFNSGNRKFLCDFCNKSYTTVYNLARHKQFVHTDEKRFQCDICQKSVKDPSSLMSHKKFVHSDERNYHCEICKKSFKNVDVLKKHALIHTDEKNYKCHVCNNSFRRLETLGRHLMIHSDEKQFKCHLCNNSFRRFATLGRHLLVHSDERNFACSVCSKLFKCAASLKNHMTTHSNIRKFVCKICNKSFKLSQQRTIHMSVHSDKKKFTCNVCNKSFKRLYGLSAHMEKHLGTKKVPVR